MGGLKSQGPLYRYNKLWCNYTTDCPVGTIVLLYYRHYCKHCNLILLLLQINGVPVLSDDPEIALDRLEENQDHVQLLVIEPEGDWYYQTQGIALTSHLPGFLRIEGPRTNQGQRQICDLSYTNIK